MSRPSGLPSAVSGHPYAAAVFVGSLATSVIVAAYAVTFTARPDAAGAPGWLVTFDVSVAVVCAALAWAVANGRVGSDAGLERGAVVALTLTYGTAVAEMFAMPARAGILTTQCCLILVAAGVVVRRRRMLVPLAFGALVLWAVAVDLVHVPHVQPAQWWSTWLITLAIALSVNLVARTERGMEHEVQQAAQSTSWRDTLTGLANRRGLARQAAQVLAVARRRGDRVWVAFLDIDHFKSVNDLLGHDAGDDVLVAVAGGLRTVTRASDLVCRWGGDEFVLLGLGDPPDERRMERRLAGELATLDSNVLRQWTPAVTVGVATVRCGAGAGSDDTASLSSLLTAADHRMYARRNQRRRESSAHPICV